MSVQSAGETEKMIRRQTGADDRTMQMLLTGIDSLRQLVDDHAQVLDAGKLEELRADVCASQKVQGMVDACTIVCGEMSDVRKVAEGYVGAQFIESDEDALDAVCELINTANGVFARSIIDDDEDLEPPFYRHTPSIVAGDEIYVLTMRLCDATVRFCIAYGAGIAGE
ncbi:MAG: hypothetical protein IJQ12_02865 [Lachnospiraceae bacterium]|nr:hypothetical protein [Lachnospiraceae bacterium]